MATSNHCNTSTPETAVCKFYKEIKGQKKLHKNELKVFDINIRSHETECDYALCHLEKTQETYEFYQNLNNFQLFDMVKSAEIIKVDIDQQAKADQGELGKLIAETSKSLNDLQAKLHKANNEACSMRNCLQSVLGFKDDEGDSAAAQGSKQQAEEPEELICTNALAKKLSKNSKDVANAMIKVAGIHTFSNLETLKPFADSLISKLSTLNVQTNQLVANAQKGKEEAQGKLTEVVEQLNKEQFSYSQTVSKINAHKATLDFICSKECCPYIGCVDTICERLGEPEAEATKSTSTEKDDDCD